VVGTRDAVTIRAASPADAEALAHVHVEAWRWAYRDQLPEDFLTGLSVPDRRAMWTQVLADRANTVHVADADSGLVGFTSGGPSSDEDAPDGTGEIFTLYVLERVQGTGVGRALLEASVAALRSRGFTRGTLWVMESNQLGRGFYERAGWTWDGTISQHHIQCANLPVVRYRISLASAD
jgi:ribosomal protein S18 acetylase RimI-like enzyme